jgi:hypothetical protein
MSTATVDVDLILAVSPPLAGRAGRLAASRRRARRAAIVAGVAAGLAAGVLLLCAF